LRESKEDILKGHVSLLLYAQVQGRAEKVEQSDGGHKAAFADYAQENAENGAEPNCPELG